MTAPHPDRSTATPWWRSIAFTVVSLPWGLLVFTVLVYGIVLALATGPLWFLTAPATVAFARQAARAERRRLAATLGGPVSSPYRPLLGRTWLDRLFEAARDPATWRDLGAMAVLLPSALVALGGAVAWLWASITMLTAWGWLGDGPLRVLGLDVSRLAAAIVLPAVGALLLALAPVVLPRLLRLPQVLMGALLARDRAALRAQTTRLARSLDAAEQAAEAERRRIERDLHDGVQPRLVTLAIDLGLAQQALARGEAPRATELVRRAHEQAKLTITELREVARGIHPGVLERHGLAAALATLGEGSAIPVDVRVDLPGRPEAAVERAAWFVAAESVTNAVRHSGAGSVRVHVGLDGPGRMIVRAEDDGCGGARLVPRHGLDGLRARAESLGGSMDVLSPPGGPTLVQATLPYPGPPEVEVG